MTHQVSHLARLLAVAMSVCLPSPTEADARKHPSFGVDVHLWGAEGAEIDRQLDCAERLGARLIRFDVPWKKVEAEVGKLAIPPNWDYIVDGARRRGIGSVLILDYGNKLYEGGAKPVGAGAHVAFATYAGFLAEHFTERVAAYEIWNEWDIETGGLDRGRAEDYLRLAALAQRAIRVASPSSKILVGAASSVAINSLIGEGSRHGPDTDEYLERALDGGLLALGDALSIHLYSYWRPGAKGGSDGIMELLRAVDRKARAVNGGRPFPIWVTEVGWPTASQSPRVRIPHDLQAAYAVRSYEAVVSLHNVEAFIAYELLDGGDDASDFEHNFGLVDRKGTPKPAFKALRDLVKGNGAR